MAIQAIQIPLNQPLKETALRHARTFPLLTHPCPTGDNYLSALQQGQIEISTPQGKTTFLSQVV